MMKDYDYFNRKPGSVDKIVCKVCGEFCEIERGVYGFTSWASSMAQKKITHDSFSCRNSTELWHELALNLVMDIEKCHSPSLIKIMKEDLKEIIQKKEIENVERI